jgi:murein DD-endopeptidase MepM/ murein hydrolase activator NlpD
MAGKEIQSARTHRNSEFLRRGRLILATLLLLLSGIVFAQALYKYQAEDGSWVYTDRPPADEQDAEVRELPTGTKPPLVSVTTSIVDRNLRFTAQNEYHIPVEVVLALDALRYVELPPPDLTMRWVIEPRSRLNLFELAATDDAMFPEVDFRHVWLPGDPAATHAPNQPYRAPYAVANHFPVSQAYPMGITHNTPDSRHAVDIAMPIGTDIYAARAGVVFEVSSTNFRGGVDIEEYAASANLVRIMHDDGTHAVYAHLNWNTIRVRPGDRVERGEYIADSGNTGFSSGPHLHFAVLQNLGMRIASVPVLFEGPNSAEIVPATGNILAAY